MSLIRPELEAALVRWREVIAGGGAAALGVWIATFGGPFWLGLGLLIAAGALAFAVNAWRRLRFRPAGLAPGIVQLVEGQIAYFGPAEGGFAALTELDELRLEQSAAGLAWVLVHPGGELRIPVAATGAEALYDAFAALPGIDMAAVLAAMRRREGGPRVVWRRRARPALT